MFLKHAAMFLVLIACLSAGMTSAFAVEIPQVRNHAPQKVSVEAGDQSNDVNCSAQCHRQRWHVY
jgi:hypothetical protein